MPTDGWWRSARRGVVVNLALFVVFALQLRQLRKQVEKSEEPMEHAKDAMAQDHNRRRKQATIEFYATTLEKKAELRTLLPYDRDAKAIRKLRLHQGPVDGQGPDQLHGRVGKAQLGGDVSASSRLPWRKHMGARVAHEGASDLGGGGGGAVVGLGAEVAAMDHRPVRRAGDPAQLPGVLQEADRCSVVPIRQAFWANSGVRRRPVARMLVLICHSTSGATAGGSMSQTNRKSCSPSSVVSLSYACP